MTKRTLDFALALLGLLLALPLMLVIWIAIRSTSAGPAVFVQDRVGRHEELFRCFKFRTMHLGSPNTASHNASEAWVTPVGKVLRRTKLDELPQLVNVIIGDMSLVGPRPCLPSQNNLISARRSQLVFTVRPGITGLAQVAGVDMSEPHVLAAVDGRYVRTRSFLGDLHILVQTVLGAGSGDRIAK